MTANAIPISRLVLAAALAVIAAHQLNAADAPLNIGSRRELFVDRLLVGELKNASLKLHTPQPAPPVSPPRPQGHYATVLRSADGFQFYYRADQNPGNHWKNGWEQYHAGEVTLYAESKDAIRWTLPKLGLFEHSTFPEGNIVLMNEFLVNHNFTPFISTRPGVPADQKYKALGGLRISRNQITLRCGTSEGPAVSRRLFRPTESTGRSCVKSR